MAKRENEYFDGELTPEFAYKNEMLYQARRTNELLEKLIVLLQPSNPIKTNVRGGQRDNSK